jgi:peptide/nickel transport system permease protein
MNDAIGAAAVTVIPSTSRRSSGLRRMLRRHGFVIGGATLLVIICALSLGAPWLVSDPLALSPSQRLKPPSAAFPFGTDMVGRDVLVRTIYGGRISLFIGFTTAFLSIAIGLCIGVLPSVFRRLDSLVMRIMDGLMAIPAVLLAIALIAASRPSVRNVIIAITVVEVPRVVRLVRSLVLTIREQPYIDAAIASGTGELGLIIHHVLPNTIPPLLVQATFICASAMLVEAALTFLGAGSPSEIPSWGNMIAEGRVFFQIAPWTIFFPGLVLSLTVLATNLLGDGLRDMLDPRLARRV